MKRSSSDHYSLSPAYRQLDTMVSDAVHAAHYENLTAQTAADAITVLAGHIHYECDQPWSRARQEALGVGFEGIPTLQTYSPEPDEFFEPKIVPLVPEAAPTQEACEQLLTALTTLMPFEII